MQELTGVLLLNLGTPNSYKKKDVRSYLREFLQDKRVIQLPAILRWLLVNLVIVPFRAKNSAHAYAKIWQNDGSPLLVNSNKIAKELANSLGENYIVQLGMRYGQPNIYYALQQLNAANISKLIVLPLFPQYSSAATGSALEQVLKNLALQNVLPKLQVIPAFYQNQSYIQALAETIKPYINEEYDYLLMSYHGLPENQMEHQIEVCNMVAECPAINGNNQNCYRAQCYQTSRLVAKELRLEKNLWGVGFQSRLGRVPWIKPYTDELLVELSSKGIKKLVVCCPSFVADCLETLEEIGIRAMSQWQELGGQWLKLVPCLNDSQLWIKMLHQSVHAS